MKLDDIITLVLILAYAVLATIACWQKQWNKAMYWGGATVLTLGVFRMKN